MIARAMIYTVVVGLPILVAAGLCAGYLRWHGRAERWVWVAGLALAFVLPLRMMGEGPAPAELVVAQRAIEFVSPPLPATPDVESIPVAEAAPPLDLDAPLLALWLLASALLAARWAISSVRLAARTRSWRRSILDGVEVLETDGMGPAVAGFLRPRVLVPSWVRALPAAERGLVLLHESEHVRAGDHLLVGLGRLARIVAPWNPVVWLLASRLGRALELDCDRRVLRRHPDVSAYGATLLMISARTSRQVLAAAAFAESDVPLRRRILAMTTPRRAVTTVGVVAMLAVGTALLSGATRVPVPEGVRGMLSLRSLEEWQVALWEPRVITDPTRPQVIMARPMPSRPRVAETTAVIVAADGALLLSTDSPALAGQGWYPLTLDVAEGRLVEVNAAPRELSRGPRIINPDMVLAAVERLYPPRLREDRLGATVGMLFRVGATGAVQEMRIGQVSAYPELDDAAREVARTYRFLPAEADGEPVPVWVSHAIDFRVE